MKTSFWTRLFDLISPRRCPVCGRRLSPGESVLCASCHLHLPLTGYEKTAADNPMARLFWGHFPLERAAALYHYEPQSEACNLVYDLKYHSISHLGIDLGQMTARRFSSADFFLGIDAIIPIPITRKRRWQRGYNQSELIARGISHVTGIPVYRNVVRRTQFADSQTKKQAWQRRKNVEGVFQLTCANKIEGKHLLIVDDVVTTGSTVIACAQTLCQADQVRISVLSIGITS